jgi:hypothetical protein
LRCSQTQPTIDTLPDDTLLYVFDFYVAQASDVEAWHTLVHVCRRWRDLFFRITTSPESANRMHKQNPSQGEAGYLATLPIVISSVDLETLHNIKGAFEHHDRVCYIEFVFGVCDTEDIYHSITRSVIPDIDTS